MATLPRAECERVRHGLLQIDDLEAEVHRDPLSTVPGGPDRRVILVPARRVIPVPALEGDVGPTL